MQPDVLARRLGIELPILLAPMAGGPSTPELAAAVSEAGGLGAIGAADLSPEQITETARRTRALTSRPFALNLFAGGWRDDPAPDAARMLALLGPIHARLGIPPPAVPPPRPDPFPAQLEAVLDARPAAFSFTFGIPAPADLARLRARGIALLGTATTPEEAAALEDAGVDAVVAQGAEAGGHRGTFLGSFEAALVPTETLVRRIGSRARVPVVAAGGLMDAADVARALAAGAAGAQLGTAFLACPECGASPAYKRAVLEAAEDITVVTRAFSGRPARGLRNAFIEAVEADSRAVLPYPVQNALTRPMRAAAAKGGDARYLSLWAGQGVARARAASAGELVRSLAAAIGTE
jgi:nitronate monooxygenase